MKLRAVVFSVFVAVLLVFGCGGEGGPTFLDDLDRDSKASGDLATSDRLDEQLHADGLGGEGGGELNIPTWMLT
ncbi:MAG TPA: hypothetical protein PLV44_11890 [Myxococcota bacterium]|nr:hypothetical protein [Myxococcota bacterium]